MKLKKITASLAALAIGVSAMNMPTFSKAEIAPDLDFWEKASGNYGYNCIKEDKEAKQIYDYMLDGAFQEIFDLYDTSSSIKTETNEAGVQYYYYPCTCTFGGKYNSEEEYNDALNKFKKTALDTFSIYLIDHPQVYFSSSILPKGTYEIVDGVYKANFSIDIIIDENFHAKGEILNLNQCLYGYRNKLLDSLEKSTNDYSTDYEKVKNIHDYICKGAMNRKSEYDESYYHNITGLVYSRYNVGDSDGYAKTFSLFLNYCGIENVYVPGHDNDGNFKAWNIVKFDNDKYYAIDIYDDDRGQISEIFYDNFLKGSMSDFDETHIPMSVLNENGTNLYPIPDLALFDFDNETIGNPDALKFTGISAALTDGVKLNFHLEFINKNLIDADDYIEFTSESGKINQQVNISEFKYDEESKSYVYSVDLRPDQMNEAITAAYVSENPETERVTYTASVNDYANALKKSDKSTEKLDALVDSMLNYGAYAQLYTSNNLDAIDESDYPDLEAPELSVFDKEEYDPSVDGSAEGVTVKAATLLIGSKVDIRVTYDIEGFAGNVTPGDGIEYKNIDGKTAYAYVRGILPQSFDKARDITVDFDGEEVTLNFSPFSYMKYAFNDETTDRKVTNLLAAMYKYYEAASAYETASGNENASASNQ